ncbi:MAG: hypothetical protein EPN91_00020 [Salinibacterium sp.]|nr:MAG: hypothetical protein EPN91_00020 [Salinibacterium sp.]
MTLEYATFEGVTARLGWDPESEDESAESESSESVDDIAEDKDEALLRTMIGQQNAWMETRWALGGPVGPSDLTSLTLDGRDARSDRKMMFVRIGMRDIARVTVDGRDIDDWVLRPLEHDRLPGWPALQIWRKHGIFTYDWGNVVLYASDESDSEGGFGFAAIPEDLTDVAETTIVRAWHSKRAGQQDMSGNTTNGQPMVSRYVSERDRETLRGYRDRLSLTRGFASVWTG